jgi:hypothetical protein
MTESWEASVRTAVDTILRYPEKLSDGLEAELYALLEKLGAGEAGGRGRRADGGRALPGSRG